MKCTKCKKETDRVRTEHIKYTDDCTIRFIPDDEKWCTECCNDANLSTLSLINEKRKNGRL